MNPYEATHRRETLRLDSPPLVRHNHAGQFSLNACPACDPPRYARVAARHRALIAAPRPTLRERVVVIREQVGTGVVR